MKELDEAKDRRFTITIKDNLNGDIHTFDYDNFNVESTYKKVMVDSLDLVLYNSLPGLVLSKLNLSIAKLRQVINRKNK